MGIINMVGKATMEFEPDYCEFHITVSVINETSGDAISKGRYRTEEILRLLQNKLGIDVKTITLKAEETKQTYFTINNKTESGYKFIKKFYFRYEADNHTTESIVALLEQMADVEYDINFKLENEQEKEQLVMSSAVNNAKEKAEKLATALGSHITGFEEIKYKFNENVDDYDLCDVFRVCADEGVPKSLASDLKNPKIEISKSVDIIWTTD